MKLLGALILTGLLSACATTSEMDDFHHLRLGMEKGEVTDRIGSPTHSDRRANKDWWYYTIHDEAGKPYERMVVFNNGKMVYAGRIATRGTIKPAEKIDLENAKTNKALEPELNKEAVEKNHLPDTAAPDLDMP